MSYGPPRTFSTQVFIDQDGNRWLFEAAGGTFAVYATDPDGTPTGEPAILLTHNSTNQVGNLIFGVHDGPAGGSTIDTAFGINPGNISIIHNDTNGFGFTIDIMSPGLGDGNVLGFSLNDGVSGSHNENVP